MRGLRRAQPMVLPGSLGVRSQQQARAPQHLTVVLVVDQERSVLQGAETTTNEPPSQLPFLPAHAGTARSRSAVRPRHQPIPLIIPPHLSTAPPRGLW